MSLLGLDKARFAALQTTILFDLPRPESFGSEEWFQRRSDPGRSSSRLAEGATANWCVYWRSDSFTVSPKLKAVCCIFEL